MLCTIIPWILAFTFRPSEPDPTQIAPDRDFILDQEARYIWVFEKGVLAQSDAALGWSIANETVKGRVVTIYPNSRAIGNTKFDCRLDLSTSGRGDRKGARNAVLVG